MSDKAHYNRLMVFYPFAPKIEIYPETKILILSDRHLGRGNKDGADDYAGQADIDIELITTAIYDGYKILLFGDTFELLECELNEIYPAYKDVIELILTNLVRAETPYGNRPVVLTHNHDAELENQLEKYPEIKLAFDLCCPNIYYCRVVKIGNNTYGTHGDLGDFFNDDNHWKLTKWIVRNIWAVWQRIKNRNRNILPAKNIAYGLSLLKGYRYAIDKLKGNGVYGHTHLPSIHNGYINVGSAVQEGCVYYGLICNMKLYVMKKTEEKTYELGHINL